MKFHLQSDCESYEIRQGSVFQNLPEERMFFQLTRIPISRPQPVPGVPNQQATQQILRILHIEIKFTDRYRWNNSKKESRMHNDASIKNNDIGQLRYNRLLKIEKNI